MTTTNLYKNCSRYLNALSKQLKYKNKIEFCEKSKKYNSNILNILYDIHNNHKTEFDNILNNFKNNKYDFNITITPNDTNKYQYGKVPTKTYFEPNDSYKYNELIDYHNNIDNHQFISKSFIQLTDYSIRQKVYEQYNKCYFTYYDGYLPSIQNMKIIDAIFNTSYKYYYKTVFSICDNDINNYMNQIINNYYTHNPFIQELLIHNNWCVYTKYYEFYNTYDIKQYQINVTFLPDYCDSQNKGHQIKPLNLNRKEHKLIENQIHKYQNNISEYEHKITEYQDKYNFYSQSLLNH